MMTTAFEEIKKALGDKLQENVSLSNYTTIRAGGPALGFVAVNSADELENMVGILWSYDFPFKIIGSGSNILVSDQGYPGIIIFNRAHAINVQSMDEPYMVFAESGAIFGTVARQTAMRGLGGLEWANSVPGTVGGAVYGNAGAFCSDVSTDLILATILHPLRGKETWQNERFEYRYRSSILKREKSQAIILSAVFGLHKSSKEEAQTLIVKNAEKRKKTQPEGASFGSTFRNPEGQYAGKLIESVGLKGHRQGNAMISNVHGNFIINTGNATVTDIYKLICLAQNKVKQEFGVELVLEIELLGEFGDDDDE